MDTPKLSHEEYLERQCARLVACANEYIAGRIGIVETARTISFYCHELKARNDPDFITFIAIDSETGHLPVGTVRQHWASEALEKKDTEIQEVEAFFHPQATEAARNLIKKYGKNSD